jgi:signal transduction histidine kinase
MDDAPDFVMGLPLGSVFLIVGMYALFAHFVRRGYGLSLSPWFAFMAICLGIAQLIERNLMLMPPGQAAWWNHLGLLTILLFPVGLWRFIELSLGSGRLNLIRRCWQLQVLVVALIWLPHFFDWVPYERFGLQVANGAIGLQLLVGIGEGVRNLSRQEPGKRIIALGMLIFSLTGLMDIMVAFLQVDVGLELYPWGMLALILVLAFGQERAAGEAHLQLQAKTLALQRHQQELEQTVARRTAELRLATRAAQAASRAKSDFLANMSHELRTPLNAILGYAQLFQRDATLSEERTSQAAVMRQSGEHLLTLINDILDISKIEAGKLEIVPGETHLLPLIQLVSDMIEPRARAKGLEFHRDVQQSLPECVVTDGKRVRQILLNLLSNAVKFTSHGSAHLAVLRENRKLVFRVSDTGIGIAPEHLGAIFMPFQQVGSAVNPAQGGPKAGLNNGSNTAEDASYSEGAGLGLAISRNIARKMDGDIFVHSEPGRGSSFCLELPCIPAKGDLTQEHPAGLCVVGIRGACREIVADDRQENALPPMDSGPIPAPWPPDFDHLQKAARIGDVREVLREGERLKARFPEHQAALDRVLQLAAEFEILALQRLLGVTTSTAK